MEDGEEERKKEDEKGSVGRELIASRISTEFLYRSTVMEPLGQA